jgi:hypothetical protein
LSQSKRVAALAQKKIGKKKLEKKNRKKKIGKKKSQKKIATSLNLKLFDTNHPTALTMQTCQNRVSMFGT